MKSTRSAAVGVSSDAGTVAPRNGRTFTTAAAVVLVSVALLGQARAGQHPAPGSGAQQVAASGDWDLLVNGTMRGSLSVSQNGDALTGRLTTPVGTGDFTGGPLTDNTMSLTGTLRMPNGATMPFNYRLTATIDGDRITGWMGRFSFVGARRGTELRLSPAEAALAEAALAAELGAPRGEPFPRQLTVLDRAGKVVRTLGAPDFYDQPTLSPDGTRVGTFVDDAIRVFDVSTGESVRVASASRGYPVWSPDGSELVFSLDQDDRLALYRIASNGQGKGELLYRHHLGVNLLLNDWSPDGRSLAFSGGEVPWVVPVTNGRSSTEGSEPHARELLRKEFGVWGLRFSPHGRYVAYVADESGRHEVYVQGFDASSGLASEKWQISSEGGQGLVQWRSDGRELYYAAPNGWVMAADVATTPVFRAGQPRRLFRVPPTFELEGVFPDEGTNGPACVCGDGCEQGAISRNGERFVFAVPVPPERQELSVRPDILARYAGTYGVDGIEWVVSLEDDRLTIQTTLGRKAPLFAESDTRFFLKATNLDLEFASDDTGAVVYLVMYRGGAPRLAIRR